MATPFDTDSSAHSNGIALDRLLSAAGPKLVLETPTPAAALSVLAGVVRKSVV